MKSFRVRALAVEMQQQTRARALEAQRAASPPAAPPPKQTRKQRRTAALLNRKLAERFKKDNIPAEVKVLPDGGLQVKVDARSEEKKARQAEVRGRTELGAYFDDATFEGKSDAPKSS